jgi:hypothetical protein
VIPYLRRLWRNLRTAFYYKEHMQEMLEAQHLQISGLYKGCNRLYADNDRLRAENRSLRRMLSNGSPYRRAS